MTLRQKRIEFLVKKGFTHNEALTFSKTYNMTDYHKLTYLRDMIRWRNLYVNNLKKRGYTDRNIQGAIAQLYYKNDWLIDGKFESWQMLKKFRKQAIADGKYKPPVKKGAHHGVNKDDVDKQRKSPASQDRVQKAIKTRLFVINHRLKDNKTMDIDEYQRLMAEKERLEKQQK